MNKIETRVIDDCNACHNLEQKYPYAECSLAKRKMRQPCDSYIPEWCPLPNADDNEIPVEVVL